MKYIYYEGKDNYYYKTIKKRVCDSLEVELKPLILGLCGSDLHKFLDDTPNNNYLLTHVLGHEICALVTNVGKNVKNIKVGDRVVVNPFNIPKDFPICESFSLTDEEINIVGRNIDGGYSEIIYLPENCLFKLPEEISSEDAIFIDDIAVALHSIHYINKYKEEINDMAIIGDGPLGILIYRLLKLFYPNNNIVLFSRNEEKLSGLNIKSISFQKIDLYNESFDVVFEVVGGSQSQTLNKSILLCKNNSLILCLGVFNFNYMASLNVRSLFYKQCNIKGINSYCNKYDDFTRAIELLESKKLFVNDLITKKIEFSDSIDFINNYKKTKNNIKTIFKVN